jgi:hypothetical protein
MSAINEQVQTKEQPIIFGSESVRAILAGIKTQTRRVVKLKDTSPLSAIEQRDDDQWFARLEHYKGVGYQIGKCPYGRTGDRLWVREAWAILPRSLHPASVLSTKADRVLYREQASPTNYVPARWASPIFMPRAFSRLTLEIINVRVERLKDLSHEDAIAEGVREEQRGKTFELRDERLSLHQLAFSRGWDELNAKRGYSWDSNPWVWVVEFRRIEQR